MNDLDQQWLLAINGAQGVPWVDSLMQVITLVGTAYVILPLAALALWVRRVERSAWLAAALMGGAMTLLDVGLKYSIDRRRPPGVVPGVRVLGPMLTSWSFPSGHTLTAFALVGLLLFLHRRWALVFAPLAIAVGLSRVYLGVHYPSDALAGAVLGLGGGYGFTRVFALLGRSR